MAKISQVKSLISNNIRAQARKESLEKMRTTWGTASSLQPTTFEGELLNAEQGTLTGGTTPTKVPEASLTPAEKAILRCMRSAQRGLTGDDIRDRMKLSGISDFERRLRDLRQKGYATSHEDAALKQLLWYPTEKQEATA